MKQEEKKEFMEWAMNEVNLASKSVDCHTEDAMRQACHLLDEYLDTTDDNGYSKAYDIFTFLLKGLPLTPLEDRDEDWLETRYPEIFVHKRRPCLYKKINDDHIQFIDAVRFRFINSDGKKCDSKSASCFMNDMFPIQFPYFPEENQIRVYLTEFEYMGVVYTNINAISTPEGIKKTNANLKMYGDGHIEGISHEEFMHKYMQYDEAMEDTQNA